jgi:hypothetical protein
LSARESVIDNSKWITLQPFTTTVDFLEANKELKEMGNQRNSILKFGA